MTDPKTFSICRNIWNNLFQPPGHKTANFQQRIRDAASTYIDCQCNCHLPLKSISTSTPLIFIHQKNHNESNGTSRPSMFMNAIVPRLTCPSSSMPYFATKQNSGYSSKP